VNKVPLADNAVLVFAGIHAHWRDPEAILDFKFANFYRAK